jgi:aspartyl-tRNA(Asn)/glutamyl-tRNA(Gln) amidotransferase subunit A
MTIVEAAAALRARRVSSAELTAEALAAVARLDPTLRAFITVLEDGARAAARRADDELARGVDRGPLHGIPYAAKDLFETRGVRTTGGSKIFAGYIPDRDAAVVERLAEAGAVLIGKTNMHELAYGMTSINPHYGAVRNPWDHERVAGGSSGGSAVAVVTGMAFLGLGTDTGGSIRVPASFCGCVGLKPTYGRVSRRGVLPLSYSQDHVGPLTRSVRDAALALNTLAGDQDFAPPERADLRGVRLGVVESLLGRVEDAVRAATLRAADVARRLGAQVSAATLPAPEPMNAVGTTIVLAEAAAALAPHLHRRADFGDDVRALLDQGRLLSAADYINAQRVRRRMRDEFAAVWKTHDCLVLPSTPLTAPRVPEADGARAACAPFTRPFNLLGVPTISIPGGFDQRGLPIGLQLVAGAFEERKLLTIAAALDDALGVRALPQ